MGILILYIPLGLFNYYRNEHDKRKFFAMGIGAGISAAFGAPIGGSLFAYELTKPNTFWTFSLTWRVFFCCSICTFFLNIFKSIQNGSGINITYAGLVKLGDSNAQTDLSDIPASIIIGIIGGLMGSGFIFFNAQINGLRKKYLGADKVKKTLEAMAIIFVTSTLFFVAPVIDNNNCQTPGPK